MLLPPLCSVAREYAGALPTSHPLLSPIHAPAALLANLPPLLLAVGGGEVLLGENLRFAQLAQAAGAAVQVEVYESMWSAFIHPEPLIYWPASDLPAYS
eukprot:COSAG05_NODE_267_length_12595_cov_7.076905_2_plen_99_part_00